MQTIVLILVLAITVEALIQYSKTIIEMLEKKQYKTFATQLAAILTSVFICFAAGVDLYVLGGVSFVVPWGGFVCFAEAAPLPWTEAGGETRLR